MKKLKEILFLSDKGYTDLKKAIIACTITNLAMLLPFCITVMVFSELLNPFLGQELDWQNIWLLWGAGIISAIIALFDWRLALCVFITLPIAFLVIWCSRKYQIKLFEKQQKNMLVLKTNLC